MPLTDAELTNLATTQSARLASMSLHNGDPGSTGANEISGGGYGRLAPSFNIDGDGDISLAAGLSFDGLPSQAVTHVGFWSGPVGGTFRGGFALTGDAAFSTAGEYNVTAGTIAGTSTG